MKKPPDGVRGRSTLCELCHSAASSPSGGFFFKKLLCLCIHRFSMNAIENILNETIVQF